ncbi:MAG: hypothetical protein HON04_06020 [Planctomicrobium sp.]|jgi:uncharacterized lipoprotein YbaY|nr:hypothetical protein [Planctomicrobium sp.]
MKRTSLLIAVAGSLLLSAATVAEAIDTTKTGGSPTVPLTNHFNPANLPGQGNLGLQGRTNDPFLPNDIYNPFPTLPGVTPGNGTKTVPNPDFHGSVRITPTIPTYIPPGQQPIPAQLRWRLGVRSRDTETGVQIHEVFPNAAASRAGLEPSDVIVAVSGHQVGIVNGSLQELSREFEAHAGESGMVTMLVQDHRTRTLQNVSVQLDSRFSRIQGSLAVRSGARLPNNAIVMVELQEIVRQGAAPLTIAHQEIKNFNPNRNQIPFQLEYDPAQVSHRGNYVLTASVLDNGRSVFETVQSYQINGQGYGDGRTIAMQLEPVQPEYGAPIHIDQDAQIATIVKWFNDYLGRPPSDRELSVWLDSLQRGYSLRQVQLELLGHNQFFNRCGRDKETYITRIHQLLVGKNPTQPEMAYWIGRYDAKNGIRRELAREFQDAVGIR